MTVLLAVEVDAVVHPAAVGKVLIAARVHVIALGVLLVKGIEVELVPHEHHLGHLLEIHIDAVHPGRLRRGRRGRGGDLRGRRRRRGRGLPLPEQEDGAYGQERRRAQEGQDQGQRALFREGFSDQFSQLRRGVPLGEDGVAGHEGVLQLLRGRGPVQVYRDHQLPARVQSEEFVHGGAVRFHGLREEQHQGVPLPGVRGAHGDALCLEGVQDGLHPAFVSGSVEGIDGSLHGFFLSIYDNTVFLRAPAIR